MQIGNVFLGLTWQKPANLHTYLSIKWKVFIIELGTLVLYADWNKY